MAEGRILTVFGGSAPSEGEQAYRQAQRLGELAAEAGWAVATGGYIGTMEAVSRGASGAGGRVIGVTCEEIEAWRPVRPNSYLTEEVRRQTLRDRLYALVEMGDGWIALPGGIGTLSEVALAWSLVQTEVLPRRPLVLVGSGWRDTLETFLAAFPGYVPADHSQLLATEPDVEAAWQRVQREAAGDEPRRWRG